MKPLTGDQQLRSLSLSYCVALQALNQNPLHEEEGAWMQAPIEASRRGVGEVFSLDILSHRMSVIARFFTNNRLASGLPTIHPERSLYFSKSRLLRRARRDCRAFRWALKSDSRIAPFCLHRVRICCYDSLPRTTHLD